MGLPFEPNPTTYVSGAQPFPDRWIGVFTAEASTTITDLDTFQGIVISGNSAHDPFAGVGTAQPVFHDQLAALYGRYLVVQSWVEVYMAQAVDGTTGSGFQTGGVPVLGVIVPSNSSAAFSNFDDMLANPWARRVVFNPSGNPKPLRSVKMSSSRINGVRTVQFSDREQAAIGANPSDEWFWHLAFQTDNVTAATAQKIRIVWHAEIMYFDRENKGLSLERAQRVADERDRYLRLKAMTPDKTGRLPPKGPLDDLRAYVEDTFVHVETKSLPGSKDTERKETGGAEPMTPGNSAGVRRGEPTLRIEAADRERSSREAQQTGSRPDTARGVPTGGGTVMLRRPAGGPA